MGEDNFKRLRFSVPKADVSVFEWIEQQSNLSASIRQLIKDHIRKYGYTDVTCAPVEMNRKVGKPKVAELEAREAMMESQIRDAVVLQNHTTVPPQQTVQPVTPMPVQPIVEPVQPVSPLSETSNTGVSEELMQSLM